MAPPQATGWIRAADPPRLREEGTLQEDSSSYRLALQRGIASPSYSSSPFARHAASPRIHVAGRSSANAPLQSLAASSSRETHRGIEASGTAPLQQRLDWQSTTQALPQKAPLLASTPGRRKRVSPPTPAADDACELPAFSWEQGWSQLLPQYRRFARMSPRKSVRTPASATKQRTTTQRQDEPRASAREDASSSPTSRVAASMGASPECTARVQRGPDGFAGIMDVWEHAIDGADEPEDAQSTLAVFGFGRRKNNADTDEQLHGRRKNGLPAHSAGSRNDVGGSVEMRGAGAHVRPDSSPPTPSAARRTATDGHTSVPKAGLPVSAAHTKAHALAHLHKTPKRAKENVSPADKQVPQEGSTPERAGHQYTPKSRIGSPETIHIDRTPASVVCQAAQPTASQKHIGKEELAPTYIPPCNRTDPRVQRWLRMLECRTP